MKFESRFDDKMKAKLIPLCDNSLIIMPPMCQKYFWHSVPKGQGMRRNFTGRRIRERRQSNDRGSQDIDSDSKQSTPPPSSDSNLTPIVNVKTDGELGTNVTSSTTTSDSSRGLGSRSRMWGDPARGVIGANVPYMSKELRSRKPPGRRVHQRRFSLTGHGVKGFPSKLVMFGSKSDADLETLKRCCGGFEAKSEVKKNRRDGSNRVELTFKSPVDARSLWRKFMVEKTRHQLPGLRLFPFRATTWRKHQTTKKLNDANIQAQ